MKLNVVPARTGILWVKLGIQTFLKQPLALAGLFFMYMAAVVMVAQIPVLGTFIGGLLVPAATLGLMAATAEASKGRFPMPWVLVSAFRAGRQRVRAMLVLGLIYTAGSLLATALGTLVGGPMPTSAEQAAAAGPFDTGTLAALLMHTPLFLMFWHAPALVHWHGVSPAKSLFFSTVACLRNFGALAVYSLMWTGVFLGVAFIFGTIGLLLGGPETARAVMLPTALLMAAMFSTSIYFTFRDSFVAEPEPALPPTTPTADGDPS
ncbi:MAG TPA: BPSS1780 family membrane protein [Ramlibacter sp.]|nr:BPSS1780 family membrane protein [Ramlibacter sp.]